MQPIPQLRFLIALCLTSLLAAQQAPVLDGRSPDSAKGTGSGTSKDDPTANPECRFTGSYNESASRDLFRACDSDSDDRLDVFETAQALDTMHDAKDSAGFARLDLDRDGYVTWPEFNQYFRQALRRDGVFRVRTCRRLLLPTPEPRAATPLQQFLQLHDTDQNGGLDSKEVEAYLRQANLPPMLGGLMKTLDLDHSGRIEEAELAPWFERLQSPALLGAAQGQPSQNPLLAALAGTPPFGAPSASTLLPPWSAADENHDGTIDVDEFAKVLRRLDVNLARWAKDLLRALDKNKDGVLSADELPSASTGNNPAAAKTAAPLPREAPLR